jgi:hypothetical protein
VAHLTDGFDERQRFDIANRPANLHNRDVNIGRHLTASGLDLVGDVRNHLHRLAKIIAAAFAGNDVLVNAPGCQVIALGQMGVSESLVMAKVQVGFRAIVGHEYFTMLKGAHGARIDVEIRVEFLERDPEAAAFH